MIEENKEDENQDKVDYDPTRIELGKEEIKDIPKNLFHFFLKTISIKDEVNRAVTITNIKDGIEFYGSNVWILICSIIVASIGLNLEEPAVIIGAMLISPLMGPIRGLGLALATNDFQTLIKSLINFAIMVGVSLIASYLYFLLTPLKAETSELLGRTKPHVLIVLVAFFGGLAGVIAAATHKLGAAGTIIPGVAIATALMPPMCTAGYGLAIGNFNYFFGAMYLFLLNSVFIALSTVIVLRLLNFPKVSFVNKRTEKKVKIYILAATLLIIIPSIFKFVTVIKESIFEQNVASYIDKLEGMNETRDIRFKTNFNDGSPEIKLIVSGEYVDKKDERYWIELQKDFDLGDVNLTIKQNAKPAYLDTTALELNVINKLYENQLDNLNSVSEQRDFYRNELARLKASEVNLIALEKRIKTQFPEIEQFTFAKALESNFTNVIDTVYTVNIHWSDDIDSRIKAESLLKLEKLIKVELELATKKEIGKIRVLNY
jgi:uncharacterized hydrophobic protein (TIGR00271 family)